MGKPSAAAPVLEDALFRVLDELDAALTFYDKVASASSDEQIAVGQDHYERLDKATRAVTAAYRTRKAGGVPR